MSGLCMVYWWDTAGFLGIVGQYFSAKKNSLSSHVKVPTCEVTLKWSLQLECFVFLLFSLVCNFVCLCVFCVSVSWQPGDSFDSCDLLSSFLVSGGWHNLSQRQNRPPANAPPHNIQATQQDINKFLTTHIFNETRGEKKTAGFTYRVTLQLR